MRLSLAFVCFTFFGLSGPATVKCEQPSIRVAAWNLHWLGRPDRRRGVAQKPEDVAKYIQASQAALVALNEVSANEGTNDAPTNKTLTRAFAILKTLTGDEWKHVLFLRDESNDKDLLCGVAWNTSRVKMVGKPFRIPVRKNKQWSFIWNRHPYAVKFSTGEKKTDLVLIPVHMKSNRGGARKTSEQRAQEARTLIRCLGQVQNQYSDDDLVILGDFNTLYGSEPSQYRFAVAGLKDLNSADEKTWIKDNRFSAAPFDRILLAADQPESKKCQMTVFKKHHLVSEETFRKFLSDHYLIYTDIPILEDDD